MIEAVFISDLHLSPTEPDIRARFDAFIDWALTHAKSVYILGDFFHAWAGDDAIEKESSAIASQLSRLSAHGIKTYYMHGNRDFLLGRAFARQAGFEIIKDPTCLLWHDQHILLTHGDRYCTLDKGHQWLRRVTRNALFPRFFLSLPRVWRLRVVDKMRAQSMQSKKTLTVMDVVEKDCLQHLKKQGASVLIHGHTHQPGVTCYQKDNITYHRYVLSDWDNKPSILCYNRSRGFYFELLPWG